MQSEQQMGASDSWAMVSGGAGGMGSRLRAILCQGADDILWAFWKAEVLSSSPKAMFSWSLGAERVGGGIVESIRQSGMGDAVMR